jgi:hypothetical protein
MPVSFDRKKIVSWLIAGVVILLIAHVAADKYYKPRFTPEAEKKNISHDSVANQFKVVFAGFGIKEEWIKPQARKKNINSGAQYFSVILPKDLPIPLILKEISNNFSDYNIIVNSSEKKINGLTLLEIISNNELILSAEIDYRGDVFRKRGEIGFILKDISDLKIAEIEEILNFPDPFGAALIPSKENSKFTEQLQDKKKESVLLLNDQIAELDFKLDPGYSESRLKLSMSSIAGSFRRSAFFIIEDNSMLQLSSIYPFIKEEISKRNIRFYRTTQFTDLTGQADETVKSSLKRIAEEMNDKEGKLIFIDAEHLIKLQPEIVSLRKIGYRFVNPSKIAAENYEAIGSPR